MEYKLNIDKSLIVEEEITVKEANATISKFNLNRQNYVDETISSYSTDPKYSNYTFDRVEDNVYSSGVAKTSYLDLEQFKSKNILMNYFFSDVSMNKNGNTVTLDFISNSTNELLDENKDEGAILNSAKITISLPFKVTENNADVTNKKDNSYTWNYSNNVQDKSIHLVFDTSKKHINISIPSWVFVLSGIIGVIIILGIYVYYRYRKNSVL
jgi:hypothetical protein